MLERLKLINSRPSEELEKTLQCKAHGQVFILRTCQRTLVLGFNERPNKILESAFSAGNHFSDLYEEYVGLEAYEFLLQTICGLKSRILGENEIVHQFKEAYGTFLAQGSANRLIQNVLEKLFKDAKEIRTKHLRNIGLQTYAGISRKIFVERFKPGSQILVLGSGQLAEDFIKISHRRFDIIICARNGKRVKELKDKFSIKSLPWDKKEEIKGHEAILNTIGTKEELLSHNSYAFKVFVDLGEPSPFAFLRHNSGYHSLDDIFLLGKTHSENKNQKVQMAMDAITEKTKHRQGHFIVRIPNGWDELLFA